MVGNTTFNNARESILVETFSKNFSWKNSCFHGCQETDKTVLHETLYLGRNPKENMQIENPIINFFLE